METRGRSQEQVTLPNTHKADYLYTVREVAEIMEVSERYIRRLIHLGELKALKIGSTKVRASEINRFLDQAEGKDYSNEVVVSQV